MVDSETVVVVQAAQRTRLCYAHDAAAGVPMISTGLLRIIHVLLMLLWHGAANDNDATGDI